MKPFQFRFARLARLRAIEELEAKAIHARALSAEHQAASHLTHLRSLAAASTETLRQQRAADHISPAAELQADQLATHHRARERAAEQALAAASAQTATTRAAHAEARRATRALERLEERQRDQWRIADERETNATLDETAARRHSER